MLQGKLTAGSKKMYKTKINQWGLKKNYNTAEKEQLARIVKLYRDSGRGIPPLTLRNRAVKMNRVRRFCKKQKFLEEICDALPAESCSKGTTLPLDAPAMHRPFATDVLASTLQVVGNSSLSPMLVSKMSFDPERPFSTASRDSRIELILFQTKVYHQSLFDCTKGLNVLNSTAMLDDRASFVICWRDKLTNGAHMISQQKLTRGWQMIDEACHMAKQVLERPHKDLLKNLLYLLGGNEWFMFPDLLRTSLLRFFTKLSAATLGCNHPISVCFYHLQEQEIIADVTITAFEVLMDIARERSDPSNRDVWDLKLVYCRLLRERGEYTTAQSYVLQFLKQCEDVFSGVHWRSRSFLFDLAHIHYEQGLHELAEREYQEILQQGRQGLGNQFPDFFCIVTLYKLAEIRGRREDFTQSEEYWRQTLAGAIKEWGVQHEVTIFLLLELERSFTFQQRDAETWLRQNFGLSCV
jgi:tetratricopeptide (TPR) repeat protein